MVQNYFLAVFSFWTLDLKSETQFRIGLLRPRTGFVSSHRNQGRKLKKFYVSESGILGRTEKPKISFRHILDFFRGVSDFELEPQFFEARAGLLVRMRTLPFRNWVLEDETYVFFSFIGEEWKSFWSIYVAQSCKQIEKTRPKVLI